jgi:excisionase family DNA binding protein
MSDPIERSLTPTQLADIEGVDVESIYRLIRKGRLHAYKVGRVYRITVAEVQRFRGEVAR